MNKKKATEETVNAFIKAVYPEMTALATTFGSEESILKDATEKIAALEKTATEQDNCILHFQARVAALKAEIERLKFGREPLPCPRADK